MKYKLISHTHVLCKVFLANWSLMSITRSMHTHTHVCDIFMGCDQTLKIAANSKTRSSRKCVYVCGCAMCVCVAHIHASTSYTHPYPFHICRVCVCVLCVCVYVCMYCDLLEWTPRCLHMYYLHVYLGDTLSPPPPLPNTHP